MAQSFNLSQFTWHFPGKGEDFALYAAAVLAAQRVLGRHSRHDHVVDKLEALAEQLKPRDAHDGLAVAREWLSEARIDPIDMEPLQKMYNAISREVDTDHAASTLSVALDVLDTLFAARHFGMSRSLPLALAEMVEVEPGDRIACAFPLSASVALEFAQNNDVSYFVGDPTTSMVVALLGLATDAKLTTDRRDPLSGAYLGTRRAGASNPWEDSKFAHAVAVPPFGAVYDLGGEFGRKTAESIQFGVFQDLWSKSLTTFVTDGWLNRTAAADVAARRSLLERNSAIVTSLPAGVWGRSSGLQTTLLQIYPSPASNVVFVDGRSMGSSGRPTSSQLARRVEELIRLHEQPDRFADVPLHVIEANHFNLSVDRYVKSALVRQMEAGLSSSPTVALCDIAEIIRPQAARPLRDEEVGDAFEAFEVTTSDIDEGTLLTPARRTRFQQSDVDRVMKSAVRPGDLVISVKGRVGIVGVVPARAPTNSGETPWIISQSFAILRLPESEPRFEPNVLGAMLTAPWAQERLQALAGGSTVPMISMSDLRSFTLPIPDEQALADTSFYLTEIEQARQMIARMQRDMQKKREKIWAGLWALPLNTGEDGDA